MRALYLAGPEVFFADTEQLLARKADLAVRYGFEPIIPDAEPVTAPAGLAPASTNPTGLQISAHNEALIARSDLCIANLTPFRGVSADPGTVFEVGFAVALGKTVFGYTNDPRDYVDRITDARAAGIRFEGDLVEDHGMIDNLMIEGALVARGWPVARTDTPLDEAALWTDLGAFERCLARAAALASATL